MTPWSCPTTYRSWECRQARPRPSPSNSGTSEASCRPSTVRHSEVPRAPTAAQCCAGISQLGLVMSAPDCKSESFRLPSLKMPPSESISAPQSRLLPPLPCLQEDRIQRCGCEGPEAQTAFTSLHVNFQPHL